MSTLANIPTYILCGGKSSRMGSDKGLVKLQGRMFIDHIINSLKSISNSIYLVTSNEEYSDFGYVLLQDNYFDGRVGELNWHNHLSYSGFSQGDDQSPPKHEIAR